MQTGQTTPVVEETETKRYQSHVGRLVHELANEIERDNREAFHQGFVQGAQTFFYFLANGRTPEQALAACQKHTMITLEEAISDDDPAPEISE